jgi:hypothetical protein
LNGTAVVDFHEGSELTNLCVLHRGKVPLYHGVQGFGSRRLA